MRKTTGIRDVSGLEICEGDIVETELGSKYEIFWDDSKKSLMAKNLDIDTIDPVTHQYMIETFGDKYLDPSPFSGVHDLLGLSFVYKIVKR